jgi:hypothetical protein
MWQVYLLTSPLINMVVMHGPFTPNVSLVSKILSSCIHQRNISVIQNQYHNIPVISHICNNKNTQTINISFPDSIWSPRGSIDAIIILNLSRIMHTQEKPFNSTYWHIYNQITYHHIHNIIIIHSETINHIMNRITCTQVSSNNKSHQVQARARCYITPLSSSRLGRYEFVKL